MKKVRGVQRPQKKNAGGMLHGPSHEQGGIPAIVGGSTPVELEGGEYIVNAQTVNAVGQPFLDKLNSTETEYHTGGYEQGQLPNPSNFDKGGRVKVNKNKLQNITKILNKILLIISLEPLFRTKMLMLIILHFPNNYSHF